MAIGLGLLVVGALVGIVAIAYLALAGVPQDEWDEPRPSLHEAADESPERAALVEELTAAMADPPARGPELLALMREQLDARGAAVEIDSSFFPAAASDFKAEWVVPPGATGARRLLYLHGGGYVMGSALSHRPITDRLARIARACVLAVNYRLMPEHPRASGIEDVRAAYKWLLANGPEGPGPADTLIVAGDSAGGNLALAVIAHTRNVGLRRADAVIVMSPQTDATFQGPSLLRNAQTDVMQGPSLGPVARAPKPVRLWMSLAMNRINPSDPSVSPLFGDLSDLPPTLIQVSTAEMFLDDAVRYVNKANAAGSEVLLQAWPHMIHVWHAFELPEAQAAFEAMREFLVTRVPD